MFVHPSNLRFRGFISLIHDYRVYMPQCLLTKFSSPLFDPFTVYVFAPVLCLYSIIYHWPVHVYFYFSYICINMSLSIPWCVSHSHNHAPVQSKISDTRTHSLSVEISFSFFFFSFITK